ncbi:MAG: hypothetical protein JXQ23_01970 [Clostridia bacterium]|nr:hypothetical protein [Clostridia bacterium]
MVYCKKIIGISMVVFLMLFIASCQKSNGNDDVASSPANNTYTIKPIESKEITPSPEVKSPVITLEQFLSSDTKHVYVKYEGITGDSSYLMEYELWQKGNMTRIDYYKGGVLDSTLYADQESAMTYMHKSGRLIQALNPPEYYYDFYRQDFKTAAVSELESPKRILYSFIVDKFYKLPAAQAGYYTVEVTYVTDDTGILMQEVTGNSSYGEKPKGLNLVRNTFTVMEINTDLEDSLFIKPVVN